MQSDKLTGPFGRLTVLDNLLIPLTFISQSSSELLASNINNIIRSKRDIIDNLRSLRDLNIIKDVLAKDKNPEKSIELWAKEQDDELRIYLKNIVDDIVNNRSGLSELNKEIASKLIAQNQALHATAMVNRMIGHLKIAFKDSSAELDKALNLVKDTTSRVMEL